jgi:hypothetical protein
MLSFTAQMIFECYDKYENSLKAPPVTSHAKAKGRAGVPDLAERERRFHQLLIGPEPVLPWSQANQNK